MFLGLCYLPVGACLLGLSCTAPPRKKHLSPVSIAMAFGPTGTELSPSCYTGCSRILRKWQRWTWEIHQNGCQQGLKDRPGRAVEALALCCTMGECVAGVTVKPAPSWRGSPTPGDSSLGITRTLPQTEWTGAPPTVKSELGNSTPSPLSPACSVHKASDQLLVPIEHTH